MRVVLATNNEHKLGEVRAILAPLGIEVINPAGLGLELAVEETGATFRENALLKARACHVSSGLPSLGDDSRLVVAALDGRPGVFSARYAGAHGDDRANMARVLHEMEGLADDKRQAAFVCSLAFVDRAGDARFFEGRVEGLIARSPAGTGGFGYDPVFFVPPCGRTMAELDFDVKNSLSHRFRALEAFAAWYRQHPEARQDED